MDTFAWALASPSGYNSAGSGPLLSDRDERGELFEERAVGAQHRLTAQVHEQDLVIPSNAA